MKMKQYYAVRIANSRDEECEMLAGPMSYNDAYTFVERLPDYPRYVFIVSRLIDVY